MKLILAAVCFFSTAALAEVKKDVNYTHCNPTGIGTMGTPYRIGVTSKDNGRLVVNELYRKIASTKREEGRETMSYNDPFEMTKGRTNVVMLTENGRPTQVETIYDPNSMMAKGAYGAAEGTVSMGSRFGYQGQNCYVSQTFYKTSKGKEVILYDAALCDKLLALGQKASSARLMECKGTFAQIKELIQQTKKKTESEGKQWSGGGMVSFAAPARSSMLASEADQDFASIGAVGMCNFNRQIYGMAVESASLPMPFASPQRLDGGKDGAGLGSPTGNGGFSATNAE